MRSALVAFVVLAPSWAFAQDQVEDWLPTIVWQDRVLKEPAPAAPISRKLFLNNCLPNGCIINPGSDDSRTNRSSIPLSRVRLEAYKHGEEHWKRLVQCVRDTFKPFDIEVVTEDPGMESHFEVVVAGRGTQLKHTLTRAGGVAPFIACGATRDNVMSFVFASQSAHINYLCAAIAQEPGHIWGLEHELNARDPMTYLDLVTRKVFQNDDVRCGEFSPRSCKCSGAMQNSFRYLHDTFGLNPNLHEPTLTVTTPSEGQWVKPNFPVSAVFDTELEMIKGTLEIDGSPAHDAANGILAFNAPELEPGPHEIVVAATDAGDRMLSQTIAINVLAACPSGDGCASGFSCYQGWCTPGANAIGGLGATCETSNECITGHCASDGTASLCTATCDGDGSCPSGFECIAEANTCWPVEGGCTAGGGFSLIGMLGLLLALPRRRKS